MERYIKEHGIDSTWFKGWNDPAVIAEDSVEYAKTGFELEDIRAIGPNPRVVILDACYMATSGTETSSQVSIFWRG